MCEFLFLKFMCPNGNAAHQNGGAFITGDRIDSFVALDFDRISAARFLLYISDIFLLFAVVCLFCISSLLLSSAVVAVVVILLIFVQPHESDHPMWINIHHLWWCITQQTLIVSILVRFARSSTSAIRMIGWCMHNRNRKSARI